MNETLDDLKRKRDVVEQDVQALFETLQSEMGKRKEVWEIFSRTSFFVRQIEIYTILLL